MRWYRGEVSAGTLRNWRAQRVAPPFIKIGKSVLYPVQARHALAPWYKGNSMRPLSQETKIK